MSIPIRFQVLLLCEASTPAMGHTWPFIQYVEEVKLEAASPSLNTEVKNERNHTSTLHMPSWATQFQF